MQITTRSFLASILLVGCGPTVDGDNQSLSSDAVAEYLQALEQECSGIQLADQLNLNKRVALTFDDGPKTTTTPFVLAILRQQNIPATFFINGAQVDTAAERALLREIELDPLFEVGNHSWTHPHLPLLSAAALTPEIDRNTVLIAEEKGLPRYFRFPYGDSNCTTASAVRNSGYAVVGWHVDTLDWCYADGGGTCNRTEISPANRSNMIAHTMEKLRGKNGGVVLMHDIHNFTAANLTALISAMRAEGFTFTRLSDTNTFPQLNSTLLVGPLPSHASFVNQQYKDILVRANDAGGLTNWMRKEANGTSTPAGVIDHFLNTNEFKTYVAPVIRMYFGALGRSPSFERVSHWSGRLRAGEPTGNLATYLVTSTEFQNRFGSMNNTNFIHAIYQQALGRNADAASLTAWLNAFASGTTRTDFVHFVSQSAESVTFSAARTDVSMIYLGMLQRVPDSEGLTFWTQWLKDGNARTGLINFVFVSPDYAARF